VQWRALAASVVCVLAYIGLVLYPYLCCEKWRSKDDMQITTTTMAIRGVLAGNRCTSSLSHCSFVFGPVAKTFVEVYDYVRGDATAFFLFPDSVAYFTWFTLQIQQSLHYSIREMIPNDGGHTAKFYCVSCY
jgi:hypothetical protein